MFNDYVRVQLFNENVSPCEKLRLTAKEQRRTQVLNGVLEGEVTVGVAAGLMGVSERHAWRLLAAYRKEGAVAMAHGNRGRKPSTATSPETMQTVRQLAEGPYRGFNHTHMTEVLAEREGIDLSCSTIRRILLAEGMRSPRRRRAPRRYSRRERYPQEGMLLQIDGSRHDWLEGRGPYLTLVGAVDAATGTVPSALFRQQEDTHGYLLMLKQIIEGHGIPIALYSDRHGIFQRSPKEPESLAEQLRGRPDPTQFARALKELDITLILAHTPQAKGRIERVWGTFQDRLVSEMRLVGVSTIEQANEVLRDFIPRFNRQFGVTPAQPGSAYRQLIPSTCLDAVLCFKYLRTIANDNTVQFDGATIQLLPDSLRASYARADVHVQERLDGSIVVAYQGRTLAAVPAPDGSVQLRARNGRRANGHSPADVAGSASNGAHTRPVGAERRNGAKGPQGITPRPPDTKRPGRSRTPAPDHPWRRMRLT